MNLTTLVDGNKENGRWIDKGKGTEKVGVMGIGILWKGITLGLGAAAPIGPVNVEIARRAIRGGFWCGFLLGLGAVTVDVTYVVLASFRVRLFLDRPRIMLGMGVAGGAFLILLGVECLRGLRKEWSGAQGELAEGGETPPLQNSPVAVKTADKTAERNLHPTSTADTAVAHRGVRPKRNYLTG